MLPGMPRSCAAVATLSLCVHACVGVQHVAKTFCMVSKPACLFGAVGVITPYREQRKLLRATFEEVCGKGPAGEVRMRFGDGWSVLTSLGRGLALHKQSLRAAEGVFPVGSRPQER
jgi:hypothetical protein